MLCDRRFDKLQKYLDLFGKTNSSKDENMREKLKKTQKKTCIFKIVNRKNFRFFHIIFQRKTVL